MTDIFDLLQSNDKQTVEYAIKSIREQFMKVNDSWLMNGLFEYYLNTSSEGAMEILVNIKEPHHTYLFDRLSDSMKVTRMDTKVQALTLFGYVARRQPTWLYKLQEHCLLRDLLKLLKNEVELLPLISALLVLIVLLPIIPSVMGHYLKDIFEIFSRLACWNCNPGKIVEDQLIHMQVALYALFLRLYGMFPCNFLEYLRNQYKDKNIPIFVHTIKPMLDTVRMHPSLVTASEDTEITTERWKKMGVHDVIVECERFSLDLTDRCPHDSCQYTSGFRSRSGTANSTIETSYHLRSLKNEESIENFVSDDTTHFFSPGLLYTVLTPPMKETVPTSVAHSHAVGDLTGTDVSENRTVPQPTSPQCTISSESVSEHSSSNQRNESPVSHEDEEEELSILGGSDLFRPSESDHISQYLADGSDNKLGDEQEHGSPCTAGGLHMPNSKSINKFSKRVQRLRHHSQCNPEPDKIESSTGSSPGVTSPSSATVRRAVSCPEMKKSPVIPTKDNISRPLDEREEDNSVEKPEADLEKVNGLEQRESEHREHLSSCATQTENFLPYEHLFLGIFPSLEGNEIKASPDSSPAPFNISEDRMLPLSIYDILDGYVEVAVQSSDNNSLQHLKEQLQLVHQQLLFERHRRETHAYRNRRLLSDAKISRSLEEHNSALRDKVQLQQKDFDDLKEHLETFKKERMEEDNKLIKTIHYWENESKMILDKFKMLKMSNDVLARDLNEIQSNCAIVNSSLRETQESLLDAVAEVKISKQQAQMGEKVKRNLEQVNKELLLIGELQMENNKKMETLPTRKFSDYELEELKKTYEEETSAMNQELEAKVLTLEAHRQRVVELENAILEKDNLILCLKQSIQEINEQRFEKLETIESKYQSQLKISRALEEKIMELGQRLEFERGKRSIHSPDTSSCHEVNVTTTAGFSPHSSPLSASLASSEGSTAFHEKEVKNLQVLVDQKEATPKLKSEDYGEGCTEPDMRQTSSSRND